eukprot:CAMPEP_0177554188 /NCGR_PEP_ID=MMETSP0369-20130122/67836_1 /TAXON_ID=447022 ORGANISM="Scrippsiella hangoei-like, Strain SHHI-4" /NCGR_SAMPLE_ID=MMETSP0369 /ASSEMBLY_ACC=CAM_ASM_000364 /LENGTH=132 /DNA_ID=CAMNT_0019040167 /DNA_START=21 /DNA_END=415 /DNA_ORIENTATION=+
MCPQNKVTLNVEVGAGRRCANNVTCTCVARQIQAKVREIAAGTTTAASKGDVMSVRHAAVAASAQRPQRPRRSGRAQRHVAGELRSAIHASAKGELSRKAAATDISEAILKEFHAISLSDPGSNGGGLNSAS